MWRDSDDGDDDAESDECEAADVGVRNPWPGPNSADGC
jgi:hypothetical protein